MTAKKYAACVTGLLFVFITANLIIWHGFTKKFFSGRDLNRLGCIYTTAPETRTKKYSPPHTNFYEGMTGSFDVITIGDSFSNFRDDESYQAYLQEKYGLRVLNFRADGGCLKDFYMLLTVAVGIFFNIIFKMEMNNMFRAMRRNKQQLSERTQSPQE